MLTIDDIPESLHEWWRLNDHFERREAAIYDGDPKRQLTGAELVELEQLGNAIEIAWMEAPLADRLRLDWRMFKAAGREAWEERSRRKREGA